MTDIAKKAAEKVVSVIPPDGQISKQWRVLLKVGPNEFLAMLPEDEQREAENNAEYLRDSLLAPTVQSAIDETTKELQAENAHLQVTLKKIRELAADTVEMQMTGGSLEEAIINAELIMGVIKEQEDED